MKKFKFIRSSSSGSEDESSSDDEIPERNIPSQINRQKNLSGLNLDLSKILVDSPRNENKIDQTTTSSDNNSSNSSSSESNTVDSPYRSLLAKKTRELLDAFQSSSDDDFPNQKIKDTKPTNQPNKLSNKNKDANHENESDTDNDIAKNDDNFSSDETEINKVNNMDDEPPILQIINADDESAQTVQTLIRPIVQMNFKKEEIPKNKRQQKLIQSIGMIYDFFDHKIPVRSIICAIHNHAGLIKDALTDLNDHPTKYDNYSLNENPQNVDPAILKSYIRYNL
ncbi:hypothetical protein TRFO_22585 [Tritrichomonas foetus]|uniref:Uncharacterized protein n=1 Tax=Tritrichomonas foetus TaxID=1144522 RepID=A0A1J4KBN6_9EUKA|nr:hypothetical protein TRFO_22585 [Tritrichomonas foetus]|eukprot:OHT08823.1 hypothetical protein TRFO_22585 [Tritrichomonas foetus]